jgi:hypothetical protein
MSKVKNSDEEFLRRKAANLIKDYVAVETRFNHYADKIQAKINGHEVSLKDFFGEFKVESELLTVDKVQSLTEGILKPQPFSWDFSFSQKKESIRKVQGDGPVTDEIQKSVDKVSNHFEKINNVLFYCERLVNRQRLTAKLRSEMDKLSNLFGGQVPDYCNFDGLTIRELEKAREASILHEIAVKAGLNSQPNKDPKPSVKDGKGKKQKKPKKKAPETVVQEPIPVFAAPAAPKDPQGSKTKKKKNPRQPRDRSQAPALRPRPAKPDTGKGVKAKRRKN